MQREICLSCFLGVFILLLILVPKTRVFIILVFWRVFILLLILVPQVRGCSSLSISGGARFPGVLLILDSSIKSGASRKGCSPSCNSCFIYQGFFFFASCLLFFSYTYFFTRSFLIYLISSIQSSHPHLLPFSISSGRFSDNNAISKLTSMI